MFVAIVPPAATLAGLEEFLAARRDRDSSWRWTLPSQWHLTLAFLAQVPEPAVAGLLTRLARAAGRAGPFDLALAGGGAFPRLGRATVLYAGVRSPDDADQLRRLASAVRSAATRAGVPVDDGPFRPHVTVARSRRPTDARNWVEDLDGYESAGFTVREMALIESRLGGGEGGRPRYDVVRSFAFSAGAAG